MIRDKSRGVAWQVQIEPIDHRRTVDEQKKRFAWRTTLELHEGVDRLPVNGASKSIDGLGWVRENQSSLQLIQSGACRALDFFG
jgi:hypothetical protein